MLPHVWINDHLDIDPPRFLNSPTAWQPTNMGIRILIADSHEIARAGLRRVLEDRDIQIVAEAKNGRQAVTLASRHQVDVVVLKSQMPCGSESRPPVVLLFSRRRRRECHADGSCQHGNDSFVLTYFENQ